MNHYRYLVRLEDAVNPFEFGGKATQLNLATQHKLPVPKGFVISNSLLNQFVSGEISLEKELYQALNQLGPIAVRSSAVGEDSQNKSYAGQYISILNISSIQEIEKAIVAVQESAFSKRVKVYNERFGIAGIPKMAVLLQKMVSAKVSGILFTQDPVAKADERIIEAGWGLGESIASGLIIPDFFRLSRAGQILEQRAGNKTGPFANKLCLNEIELQKLHQLATACENVFGRELDIEWAFDDQELYLLQCRPITC
jgi:pyruvate,water dikinase